MVSHISGGWLEFEQVGDIHVVRFTRRSILSTEAVEAIGRQLFELVDQNARKFVLDFSNVESVTSTMLGKLIALHKKVEAAGGRLVLCGIGPFLTEIFKVLNLPQLIPIYADQQKALLSFRAE